MDHIILHEVLVLFAHLYLLRIQSSLAGLVSITPHIGGSSASAQISYFPFSAAEVGG